ncbi:MAG: nuclear transport factor 2 family protein [Bacteroidota bacterium]
MKFLFLLPCFFICTSFAQGQSMAEEEAAVRATLLDYINGRNQGDTARLSSAFHPQADLRYTNQDGQLGIWPVGDYIGRIEPGRTVNCIARIVSIDILGQGAQAKIELEYPNFKFADYINLQKIGGQWLIAVKTFSRQPIEENKRILFVLTSHEDMGDTGRPTGLHLGEVAHVYKPLAEAGFEIDFASPLGGDTYIYGVDMNDETTRWFVQNPTVWYRFTHAMTPDQIDANKYAAVYFPGGHGTMWDLPDNELLNQTTANIYDRGGIVAAVCHGPSGLVNVQLANGDYLVSGKRMTSFTDSEETAARAADIVPFLLETKLRARGARFIGAEDWTENVIVDDRLITGQNPASAAGIAEEILRLLE